MTRYPLTTLHDAAKLYIVYLHALRLPRSLRRTYVFHLRHILTFYGSQFPLVELNGAKILQYADIYDPYDFDPFMKARGQVFWKFIHFLKRNQVLPEWTPGEEEPKY